MSRKVLALIGLAIAIVPPTIFVCMRLMPVEAYVGMVLALAYGVGKYIEGVATEDAQIKPKLMDIAERKQVRTESMRAPAMDPASSDTMLTPIPGQPKTGL